jgi:hypothetical protein
MSARVPASDAGNCTSTHLRELIDVEAAAGLGGAK